MAVGLDKKKNSSKPRKKLGKIVSEIFDSTSVRETVPVKDVGHELFSDFDKEMSICIDRGKVQFPGDFYIVLLITIPQVYRGQVIRPYYMPRISCPSPEYDQSAWKYIRSSGSLEFLWTIPSRELCNDIKNGIIIADLSDELMLYVSSFLDGSLEAKAKRLNNEKYDIPYCLKAEDENE